MAGLQGLQGILGQQASGFTNQASPYAQSNGSYLPAYASSLLGNIDQYTSKAQVQTAGGLANQFNLATSQLKGIPGTESIIQDINQAGGLINSFGVNMQGGVYNQTQRAFGVDPTSAFGASIANANNPYAAYGLNGVDPNLLAQQNYLNPNAYLQNLNGLGQFPTSSSIAQVTNNGLITRGSGDPHFYANGKALFDFQGEADKLFNIFSDGKQAGQELIINARFDKHLEGTIMGKAGIQVAGRKLTLDKNGDVTLDGKPMGSKSYEWDTRIPGKRPGEVLRATAQYDKKTKTLTINSGEYQVKGIIDPAGLRFDIQPTEAGIAANGTTAQGVQGEILDPAHQQKIKNSLSGKAHYKLGKNAQGEGFLNYGMKDYLVNDLFDTNFAYLPKDTQARYGQQLSIKAGGA